MSDNKHADNDPERTLVTLEQLSQTIEVMTSVVNRLRQHLSEQLKAQVARQSNSDADVPAIQNKPAEAAPTHDEVVQAQQQKQQTQQQRESFVVEIRQQESEPVRKNNKTLH